MLFEYNFKGLNPYYRRESLPVYDWTEELLKQGDVVSDHRLPDVIMREIERTVEDY